MAKKIVVAKVGNSYKCICTVPAGVDLSKGDAVLAMSGRSKKEYDAVCLTDSQYMADADIDFVCEAAGIGEEGIGMYIIGRRTIERFEWGNGDV